MDASGTGEEKKKKKAQGTQEDTSILYIGFNGHQKEQITAAYIFSSMLENINLSWPLIGKTQCTCITEVLKSDLKKKNKTFSILVEWRVGSLTW